MASSAYHNPAFQLPDAAALTSYAPQNAAAIHMTKIRELIQAETEAIRVYNEDARYAHDRLEQEHVGLDQGGEHTQQAEQSLFLDDVHIFGNPYYVEERKKQIKRQQELILQEYEMYNRQKQQYLDNLQREYELYAQVQLQEEQRIRQSIQQTQHQQQQQQIQEQSAITSQQPQQFSIIPSQQLPTAQPQPTQQQQPQQQQLAQQNLHTTNSKALPSGAQLDHFTTEKDAQFQAQTYGHDGKLVHFNIFSYLLFNGLLLHAQQQHNVNQTDPFYTQYNFNTSFTTNLSVFITWAYQINNTEDFPLTLFATLMKQGQDSNIQDAFNKIYTSYQQNGSPHDLYYLLSKEFFRLKRVNSLQCAINSVFDFLYIFAQYSEQDRRGYLLLDQANTPSNYFYITPPYANSLQQDGVLNPMIFVPFTIRNIIYDIITNVDVVTLYTTLNDSQYFVLPTANKLSKTYSSIIENIARCCGLWQHAANVPQLSHPFFLLYSIVNLLHDVIETATDHYIMTMFVTMLGRISPIFHYIILGTSLHTHIHRSSLSVKESFRQIFPPITFIKSQQSNTNQTIITFLTTQQDKSIEICTPSQPNPNTFLAGPTAMRDVSQSLVHYNSIVKCCALPTCGAALDTTTQLLQRQVALDRCGVLSALFQSTLINQKDPQMKIIDQNLAVSGNLRLKGKRIPYPTARVQQLVDLFNTLHFSFTKFTQHFSQILTPLLVAAINPYNSNLTTTTPTSDGLTAAQRAQLSLILLHTNWLQCAGCGYNSLKLPLYPTNDQTIIKLLQSGPVPFISRFRTDQHFNYQHIGSKKLTQNIIEISTSNYNNNNNNNTTPKTLVYTPFVVCHTLPTQYVTLKQNPQPNEDQYEDQFSYSQYVTQNPLYSINTIYPKYYHKSNLFRHDALWCYLSLIANSKITPMYLLLLDKALSYAGMQLIHSFKTQGHELLKFIYQKILIMKQQELKTEASKDTTRDNLEYSSLVDNFEKYFNPGPDQGTYPCPPEKAIAYDQQEKSVQYQADGDNQYD